LGLAGQELAARQVRLELQELGAVEEVLEH
jgi:hypothetical protein